jgi:serine protease Do
LVGAPKEFLKAAKDYICVRVTDMTGVDINTFNFDFDLTFSVLLAHADGHVYHRYGGRDGEDALSWVSMKGLTKLMGDSLKDHKTYNRKPKHKAPAKKTVKDIAAYRKNYNQIKSKKNCLHCHQVNDALRAEQKQNNSYNRDTIWLYPEPQRLGLSMDPKNQNKILRVKSPSAAKTAGLKKGDIIKRAGAQNILTITDLQYVLHHLSHESDSLDIEYTRGGKKAKTTLRVKKGWKATSPEDFSWRASMWQLSPKPGFGGNLFTAAELKQHKLKRGSFAFKVRYIVTWGPDSHTGRNALKAGIKKNDVVYEIDGRSDFKNVKEFHTWFRFTRKVGDVVSIKILRNGQKKTIRLTTVE